MAKALDKHSDSQMMSKQASKQASKRNVILVGDCIEQLKTLPDESIDCCVTSPPYYGLRDYGTGKWVGGDPNCPHYRTTKRSDATATGHKAMMDGGHPVGDAIYKTVCPLCGAVREDKQIGLEETPEQYINHLVEVFREVKRVLKNDGTLWLNIGDSWWGSGSRGYDFTKNSKGMGKIQMGSKGTLQLSNLPKLVGSQCNYKDKDIIGIPWMLAFALRADGWYLRQDIIWSKPNPMPESVRDRCTKSHEYIFLLTKSKKYHYDSDAIKEKAKTNPQKRNKHNEGYQADYAKGDRFSDGDRVYGADGFRNKRDVWSVPLRPLKEAHFATFPEKLIEPCVLAGCRQGGIVLDPFFGSGTTGVVALKHGRDFVGCELNPQYVEIAKRRTSSVQMQFSQGVMLDV